MLQILFCRLERGVWTPASRARYNLFDAIYRSTTQVNHQNCMSYSYSYLHTFFKLYCHTQCNNQDDCCVCLFVSTQVYPQSWTAVLLTFDNAGVWNLRSEIWARQYLGQQTYVRVKSPVKSLRDEYNIPSNAILCGLARNRSRLPHKY